MQKRRETVPSENLKEFKVIKIDRKVEHGVFERRFWQVFYNESFVDSFSTKAEAVKFIKRKARD